MAAPTPRNFAQSFADYVAGMQSVTEGKSFIPGMSYQSRDGAMAAVVLEVLKANFPHLINPTTAQVSQEPTDHPSISGDYTPLTNTVRFRRSKLSGNLSPEVITRTNTKTGSQQVEVNFTTEDVMNATQLVLHELFHARSGGGWRYDGQKAMDTAGITEEKARKINAKQQDPAGLGNRGRFASVNPNGFNLEEFMANADAILSIAEIGGVVPGSRIDAQKQILDQITTEIPESKTLIDMLRRPEIRDAGAPAKSFIDLISGLLSDTSVKETSGGAKPGTPRKKD